MSRGDATPCILYPELLPKAGGLARAVPERANLYARSYETVVILTTGFSPKMPSIVAELRSRGTLAEGVVVRNFFWHSAWIGSLGVPSPEGEAGAPQDGIVTVRQRLPGRPFFRIAERRVGEQHPYAYRYYGSDGELLATTRTSRGSKHEARLDQHSSALRSQTWGQVVAAWVDEEIAGFTRPVLFSLQRELNDPVLLAARRPARKVASLHNCHYADPEDPQSGIRRSFRPLLSNPRAVDEIVCLTRQQLGELTRDVPEARLRCIPYPGRPPHQQLPTKDPRLVVFVGRLVDLKRVDHVIRAFAMVVRSVPDARLEIYGDGPESERLHQLIRELDLVLSVDMMGYSLSVQRAQARALCTVLTSKFEGFARVITESMSVGTPVVAYSVRYGPRELIRDGIDGVLVERHHPDALAEGLITLLTHPQQALEMGRRAREVCDRFPIVDFEQAWLDVVTGSHRPRKSWQTWLQVQRRRLRRSLRRRVSRQSAKNGPTSGRE